MSGESILSTVPLGFPWPTVDPFLFCAHHDDHYPAGNEQLGPQSSLSGRRLGMDFEVQDGWRMYHGEVVPGFPQHPHRGFETVTLARKGLIDHADSLGATARFGGGDVQWMTAGQGIVHSEMFPLLNRSAPNPAELFQIWLNLPRANKLVDPHFSMFWAGTIPTLQLEDEAGRGVTVTTIAGALNGASPPPPPPSSWAARPENGVAIWTITLAPGARWTLPAGDAEATRTLYFFRGDRVKIDGQEFSEARAIQVDPEAAPKLEGGNEETELLMLQGRPIREEVAHQGPFVMNTRAELAQAVNDYRRTGFGGWPWDRADPVHDRSRGRFAIHADGRVDEPR